MVGTGNKFRPLPGGVSRWRVTGLLPCAFCLCSTVGSALACHVSDAGSSPATGSIRLCGVVVTRVPSKHSSGVRVSPQAPPPVLKARDNNGMQPWRGPQYGWLAESGLLQRVANSPGVTAPQVQILYP